MESEAVHTNGVDTPHTNGVHTNGDHIDEEHSGDKDKGRFTKAKAALFEQDKKTVKTKGKQPAPPPSNSTTNKQPAPPPSNSTTDKQSETNDQNPSESVSPLSKETPLKDSNTDNDSEDQINVKDAVAKFNGTSANAPKRDLTAPTKSSAAKSKNGDKTSEVNGKKPTKAVATKPDPCQKKAEKKVVEDKSSKPEVVTASKDTLNTSTLEEIKNKYKPGVESPTKEPLNPFTLEAIKEKYKPDVESPTKESLNPFALEAIRDKYLPRRNEDPLFPAPLEFQPAKSSLESRSPGTDNYSLGEAAHNMASCDPQSVDSIGINPETTDSMVVKDGKVKYNHLTYKKVPGIMFDCNCDVKLKVGKSNFKAHREVLSEASDYFAAMFSHNMKEKSQGDIELKEISPQGFTEMLEYFYHGFIMVSASNIEDILEAARFFHVDWILEICCDYMVHHMSVENYNSVLRLSDKFCLGDLRYEIFTFFGHNLEALSQKDNFFKTLSYDLLLQFLMENIYIEAQELFVVEIIFKWLKADPEHRKDQLLSLLRQVKFMTIDPEDLEHLPTEITDIPEMNDLVSQSITYNYNIMAQCLTTGDAYLPRGARTVITVMNFSTDGHFMVYRDPAKTGMVVEQLGECGLDTVDYPAMAQAKIGNFVYAAGGYDNNYASSGRTFRFYPKYREWIEVAPMQHERVSFTMCSSDTRLFALGGVQRIQEDDDTSSENLLKTCEMYVPDENEWRNLPDLPHHAYDLASVYYNNHIYVCGGISTDTGTECPLPHLWCLDLNNTEQGWVTLRKMLTPRQGHSLVANAGKLYVQGGSVMGDEFTFTDCFANEVYDIETDQWSMLAATPAQFGHLYRHSEVLNDVIFVLGGDSIQTCLYIYDINSDTWEQIEQIGPNVQKLTILDVAFPES